MLYLCIVIQKESYALNQALRSAHLTFYIQNLTLKNYVALRTKTKSERQDARGIRQVLRLSSVSIQPL